MIIKNKVHTLWCEKYRPQILDEFVGNADIKAKVSSYINDNDVPHLLFAGRAGTGKCLDYEAYTTSFMENREVINDLLGQNPTRQKELVKLIKDVMEKRVKEQMESNKKYAEVKEGKIIIAKLDIGKTRLFAEFPLRGKSVGILHDYLKEKYKRPVITIGYGSDFMNFRCSKEIERFDVNEILALIKKKLPYAQVDGGGHAKAGSINFVEKAFDDAIKMVDGYLGGFR